MTRPMILPGATLGLLGTQLTLQRFNRAQFAGRLSAASELCSGAGTRLQPGGRHRTHVRDRRGLRNVAAASPLLQRDLEARPTGILAVGISILVEDPSRLAVTRQRA